MAKSVAIPQDIIANIIEAVGDDSCLLRTCALVSSSFLLPSRKRLFSEVYLRSDEACQRLHQFLVENPVIQAFVRSIAISYKTFEFHSLIAILRLPFCRLESFSIERSLSPQNWNNFSGGLKDALSTIIHSSTLKTLYLTRVSMPIMLFHGIHLTNLVLTDLLLNNSDGEQSSLPTSAAPEGVATTASHTVIDQCVWTFYDRMHGPPIFLPFMCCLRVFEIFVRPSSPNNYFDILFFLVHSLRVSLTSPATLEHLKFDIGFDGDRDCLSDYFGLFDDLDHVDVWHHLDSIITHPTGSRLQRVDINFKYCFYDDYLVEPTETEVMKLVLDALPLLREKGILFVEATVIELV